MYRWHRVKVASLAIELPEIKVTTAELESRLAPLYRQLNIPAGYIELLSGIKERRWWPDRMALSDGATRAAFKALARAGISSSSVQTMLYAGVCREHFEPATACRVANNLNIKGSATVHDVSNACLGVLNAMVIVANQIELGQLQCGVVVACETAQSITEKMIATMLDRPTLDFFRQSFAVLTGGSGAVAVVLVDESLVSSGHRLIGGVCGTDPQFHHLCHWGIDRDGQESLVLDSASILKHGLAISSQTFNDYLVQLSWQRQQLDRVICHQVSGKHNRSVLEALDIPTDKNYSSYAEFGNVGAVSLPLTATLASDTGFIKSGDRVSFLGIGSGFNTVMLGLEW